jgi:hypothetical protein
MENNKNILRSLWGLIQKLFFKTNDSPFSHMFKTISPQTLYGLINSERNQTIAFILSFSRNKKFINDFFDILVKNKKDVTKSFIIEYINNCPINYLPEIQGEIEWVLEKKIANLPLPRRWRIKDSIKGE